MDISRLTPQEIQRLTPDAVQFTPEERSRLTPEQCAAVLLSPDEQRQREAAWQLADAKAWREIAGSCVTHVLESYRRGDVDLRDALGAIHRAAIGCWAQDRIHLLALTAARALRI
jgi:hypothetical protein